MPYTFQLEHLNVSCDTPEDAWALLSHVMEKRATAPATEDGKLAVEFEKLTAELEQARDKISDQDATIEELEGKLNALRVAAKVTAPVLKPEPAEAQPVAVTPKKTRCGKFARWRAQIREYLEQHEPAKGATFTSLFGIPEGSITTVLKQCPEFEQLADKRWTTSERLREFAVPTPRADPPKRDPPPTGPHGGSGITPEETARRQSVLRERIVALLHDDGPLNPQAMAMRLSTPKHLINKALDDPRFEKDEASDRYVIAKAVDSELADQIENHLKASGPTRYGFHAAAQAISVFRQQESQPRRVDPLSRMRV